MTGPGGMSLGGFTLRNVPLLSRVGADRADELRTDVDAALAGWNDALLLKVCLLYTSPSPRDRS